MEFVQELTRAFSLENKVAVITGAGSGLGQEAARLFALAGVRMVIADVDEAGMAATRDIVSRQAEFTRKVDVAVRDEVEALADWSLAEAGGADVWVNGAGHG